MSNDIRTCPICGADDALSDATYSDTLKIGGEDRLVDGLQSALCSHCGAEPLLRQHIAHNQLVVADIKRRELGLLTGEQIKRIRTYFALSQKDAAELFGGGANAFSKYERGDVIQSAPMDKLLRLVFRVPSNLSILLADTRHPDTSTFYELVDSVEWIEPIPKAKSAKQNHWPMNLSGYFSEVANEGVWHTDSVA